MPKLSSHFLQSNLIKNAHKYISDNKSAHFAVWFTQVEVCGCIFYTLGWSSFRALTCAAQFEMCIFSELALAYFPSITIMWCAHIFVGSLSGQFETSAEASVHPRYSLGTCTATYLHALCTGFSVFHRETQTYKHITEVQRQIVELSQA